MVVQTRWRRSSECLVEASTTCRHSKGCERQGQIQALTGLAKCAALVGDSVQAGNESRLPDI